MSSGQLTRRHPHSAKPRLTTTKMELEEALAAQRSDYIGSKRATSASSNKRKSESSGYVFPRRREEEDFGQTYYESQFEAKEGDPDCRVARATSPTRRNNPHPNKEFMQWRLPVRVLESRQGTITAPTDALADTQERFYQDYLGGRDGDARNEVNTTVARAPFPGESSDLLLPSSMPRGVATVDFPGYPSTKWNQMKGSLGQSQTRQRPKSAMQKQKLVKASVKDRKVADQLKTWLDSSASSEEKEVVLAMLQSGTSEEMRLKQALEATLAPEALPGVDSWMEKASHADRQLVLEVFEKLSNECTEEASAQAVPLTQTRPMKVHTRRASDPLPLHGRYPTPMLYRGTAAATMLHNTRTRALGIPSRAGSRQMTRTTSGSALHDAMSKLQIEGNTALTEETSRFSPIPSMHWHVYSKRQHTPNVIHRGAIFGGPKYRGSHFDISPEWPTA